MNTRKIYIQGMHCASCEKLIKDEFEKLPNIINAKVSQKENSAEITFENNLDLKILEATAKKYGYEISADELDKTKSKSDILEWIYSILIVITLLLAYRLFQAFGLADKININYSQISLATAFLIGLTASLTTCLMVVGSVVIAFGDKYANKDSSNIASLAKPNLLFHVGRLSSFFLLGGILGLIGKQLTLNGNILAAFTILTSLIMVWLGLNMLGFVSSISSLGVKIPDKVYNKLWKEQQTSNNVFSPFILGGLTFFLPCGFTQTMQLFALASGNFLTGGLSLLAFALGTTPVLFFLGMGSSWIKNRKFHAFQKSAGILIILFSIYTFNSALAISNKNLSLNNNQKTNTSTDTSIEDSDPKQEQVIKMSITAQGFEPNKLVLKKDVPVKWIINGDKSTGCTNQIIVPELNITQDIKKGENIVRFTPTKTGKIAFSCWMGMVRGEFIVN